MFHTVGQETVKAARGGSHGQPHAHLHPDRRRRHHRARRLQGRTRKTDARLAAYADVNEANATIGVAVAAGGLGDDVVAVLRRVQNDLFDVGADLSTPLKETYEYEPLRVKAEWIDELEADCDTFNDQLEAALVHSSRRHRGQRHLHVATTVVRRAERSTWRAIETHGTEPGDAKGEGGVNAVCAAYLNRLSDLLFILARVANLDAGGDVLWQPGGGRVADPRTKKTPSA